MKAYVRLCLVASCIGSLLAFTVPTFGQNVWRSPQARSADWPRLDPSDCASYGTRYGYIECGGRAETRLFRFRAFAKAKTRLASGAQSETKTMPVRPPASRIFRPRMKIPVLMAGFSASHTVPASTGQSHGAVVADLITALSAVEWTNGFCGVMLDACYSKCKVKEEGSRCNTSCSTDLVCGSSIRLTYGQFLEFQLELLAAESPLVALNRVTTK